MQRPLEDFRHNNIGGSFIIVNSTPSIKVHLTYEFYLNQSFYGTLNNIRNLECSTSFIHNGTQVHAAIAFWYLALEAYINSIIKLCCIKKNLDFTPIRKKDLQARLSELLKLLNVPIADFNKNDVFSKVQDFSVFRNELFHDRYFGDEKKFKKANFSSIPYFCNQVDLMQAAHVFMEICCLLRYSIEGLDLMPHIVVGNPICNFYEKVDICYNSILKPYFEKVLAKFDLTADLDLSINSFKSFESTIFTKGELIPLYQVDQEREFDHVENRLETDLYTPILQPFVMSYNLDPNKIKLPKITRD